MMKRCVWLILLIVVVAAGSADASDQGFYVGVGLGRTNINPGDFDEDFSDLLFEESSTGFKLFGGYKIMKHLAVEGGYTDYGDHRRHQVLTNLERHEINVTITALDLSVVGRLPVSARTVFFAKVGMSSWDADVWSAIDDVRTDLSSDGTGLIYGGGVEFMFNKTGVRFDIDWLEIDDVSSFMPRISVAYNF
ncbi:MAG: porin family protein [bacterium]|nr:porin family protein [bacterium]